ncbi:hypothetical protein LX16_5058 [Stackebrandtia albiflava]|uniref:WD40 repeat protein n=1 Tax=Stackebrandtia albiflava TaxID=406432 RepID=A0A562UPN4_9ACTN|nr:hypothetical protein [Stackebrandtia albiflava]TWJ07572.1 hypothetical protein LX16_5058 [Stackebrandtia albiflava]
MSNDIHDHLNDIADEMPVVDMHQRALAESKRLGVRRTLIGVGAAVATVIALAGTTFAVLPGHDEAGPPAERQSDERDADPPPDQQTDRPDDAPPFPGAVYYIPGSADEENPGPFSVLEQANGRYTTGGDGAVAVDVSFDGSRYGQVADGEYRIIDRLTGEPVQLPGDAARLYCRPEWSPTRDEIAYSVVPESGDATALELVILDLGTGDTVARVPSPGCNVRWTADGKFLAHLTEGPSGVRVSLMDRSGSPVQTLELGEAAGDATHVTKASSGGSVVCVESVEQAGDYFGGDGCDLAVDTSTGETVTFEVEGRPATLVSFTSDDDRLLLTGTAGDRTLWLTGPDGTVVASTELPTGFGELEVLAYVP